MINPEHKLSVVRQCQLLDLARATAYYEPLPASEKDLGLMRRLDELHLKWPFLGARKLRDLLVPRITPRIYIPGQRLQRPL